MSADRAPLTELVAAFQTNDVAGVGRVLERHPELTSRLDDPAPGLAFGGTALLHWAAFHGNTEMAREILQYDPPLELRDDDFGSTPLGWAIYGSVHGWRCKTGDYAGTVEVLLAAGAVPLPSSGA